MRLANTKTRTSAALVSSFAIALLSSACAIAPTVPKLRAISSEEKMAYAKLAVDAAREAGVPHDEFVKIIAHESGFRPDVRGAHGEYGLGQIKCPTARSVGFTGDCSQLLIGHINLKYSARYYAIARQKCGNFQGALYLYNAGTGGSCAGRNEYVWKVSSL